jgi:thiamine biosynthesis lipoprotein
MAVGMGAIAKGYAVDMAAGVLKTHGYADFIVEGGGDTYVAGTKGGEPWKVGVQDPETRGALGFLTAEDESVVTSGNYQRFFEHEGKRYAHILDPKTGRPIPWSEAPRSVTVVAPSATDADAYATAIYVMGAEAGVAFAESRPDLDALVIDAEGRMHQSSGLEGRWQPLRAPSTAPDAP